MYKVKVPLKIKTKFHYNSRSLLIALTTSNQYSKVQVSCPKESRDISFKNTPNSGPSEMGVVSEIGMAALKFDKCL